MLKHHDAFPPSPEQERLFTLHQINPNSSGLYTTWKLKIKGKLDPKALEQSLRQVVDSTPILRTTFRELEGRPCVCIRESMTTEIEFTDLSSLDPSKKQEALDETCNAEAAARTAFSLENGPLFRMQHLQLTKTEHVILWRLHQIACDSLSARLLIARLMETYTSSSQSKNPPTPQKSTSYDSFVKWQAENLKKNSDRFDRYWENKLKTPATIDLSLFKQRPQRHSHKAKSLRFKIEAELFDKIRSKCAQFDVSVELYMLASLNILLQKVTGQDDLLVGSKVSGRSTPESYNMLGTLSNWIVFRNRIDPESSFEQTLAAIKKEVDESIANQGPSLDRLVRACGEIGRGVGRSPLFQVAFEFNRIGAAPETENLKIDIDRLDCTETDFDLACEFEESSAHIEVRMNYYEDILDQDAVRSLSAAFLELSRHFLDNADKSLASKKLSGIMGCFPRVIGQERQVVITSSFTPEPVGSSLSFWSKKLRLNLQIEYGGLDQIFQEIIDPRSLTSSNRTGVNAILLRFSDWKDPETHVTELVKVLKAKALQGMAPMIVVCCPPPPAWRKDAKLQQQQTHLEKILFNEFSKSTSVHVVLPHEIADTYGVMIMDDPESDEYGKVPYTPDYYIALGTFLSRKIQSVLRIGPKVLVLDCDNTLWDGVVGEDGVDGIGLGPHRQAIQKFALQQHKNGVLLCIASKNNEADVWEVFNRRTDMILKREHFTGHRINWMPKSQNIVSLGAELNLGIDSFVFLDDSAVEISEVRSGCPSVCALRVPLEPQKIMSFIKHLWMLDLRKVTDTDLKRSAMYAQNSKRDEIKKSVKDVYAFIESLEVKVTLDSLNEDNIARAAQMTQRTNQFNASTIRRTEADVRQMAQEGKTQFLIVSVSDRFGDYGIVGMATHEVDGEALKVDTFLLSCRVLGRGVEQKLLQRLGEVAAKASLKFVSIVFRPTAKNSPARQFLDGMASEFRVTVEPDKDYIYKIPVEAALNANSKMVEVEFEDEDKKKTPALVLPDLFAIEWAEIAADLDTVSKIRSHIQKDGMQVRAEGFAPFVAPTTKMEIECARIWQETLLVERIGLDDNYFKIGGDSLRGLMIVSKMRELGLEVKPLDLAKYPTIRELLAHSSHSGPRPLDLIGDKKQSVTEVPTTPSQLRLLNYYSEYAAATGIKYFDYATTPTLFEFNRTIDTKIVHKAVEALLITHEILRAQFVKIQGKWKQSIVERSVDQVVHVLNQKVAKSAELKLQELFGPFIWKWDIENTSLFRVVIVQTQTTTSIMLATHHLVADMVSDTIIAEDFLRLLQQSHEAKPLALPAATTKIADWHKSAMAVQKEMLSPSMKDFWLNKMKTGKYLDPKQEGLNFKDYGSAFKYKVLHDSLTANLMAVASNQNATLFDLFLTSLTVCASELMDGSSLIDVAHNGRHLLDPSTDLSRTAGLFWHDVPIAMKVGHLKNDLTALIAKVRAEVQDLPAGGFGYLLLQNERDAQRVTMPVAPVGLNFTIADSNGLGANIPDLTVRDWEFSMGVVAQGRPAEDSRYNNWLWGSQLRYLITFENYREVKILIRYPQKVLQEKAVDRFHNRFMETLETIAKLNEGDSKVRKAG